MKKALSVFLAVVMILTSLAVSFSAFAWSPSPVPICGCEDHVAGKCHCCAYCPNLDETYLTSCAKDASGHFSGSFCCANCTGIWPCDCGCDCCASQDEPIDSNGDPIFDENQQEQIVDGFQKILKIVSDAFDKFFNAIFEFLRIFDVLPDAKPQE